MVKFQERKMKKRYKNKEYSYKKILMEFPVKIHPKIDPHKDKNFDKIDITTKKTPSQEILNIELTRNKTAEELEKEKTE